MKRLFFLAFGLLLHLSLNAQEMRGKVTGQRGEPLTFTNVILLNKPDSTFLTGTTTSEDGHFVLDVPSNTSLDDCLVKVSCIGYKTMYMAPRDHDMSNITLLEETQQLNEVVVASKRPVIQMNKGVIQADARIASVLH